MKCPTMLEILPWHRVLHQTLQVTVFTLCLFEGCVLVVSVIEQLAQWHNSTVKAAMERLCSYIPEKLQGFCYILAELYGPHIAELIDREMNADVICHSLKLCKQDPGQPLCHLYSPPKVSWFSTFFQSY
uniref:Saposin B-type domain-containing protein n=1 Tax=Strigops habroptila TaxID=2489341 RepID=A0A672V1E8_STRHB